MASLMFERYNSLMFERYNSAVICQIGVRSVWCGEYLEMDKNLQEEMTRRYEGEKKAKKIVNLKGDKKRLSEEPNKCVADQKPREREIEYAKGVAKFKKEMQELRKELQKSEEENKHLRDCLNEKESELRQMKAARVRDMSDSSKKEIEDPKANDKRALYFARDVISVHSESEQEHLRKKPEESDWADEPRSSVLERSSVAVCDLLNVSANLYSRSFTTANGLRRCKESLRVIGKVTLRLFKQLQSSAKFLQSLLEEHGQGEKGRAIMDEVTALRLNLNSLLNDLLETSKQIDAAEKSLIEFSTCLEYSMSCSESQMRVASLDPKQALKEELNNTSDELANSKAALVHLRMEIDNLNEKTCNAFKVFKQLDLTSQDLADLPLLNVDCDKAALLKLTQIGTNFEELGKQFAASRKRVEDLESALDAERVQESVRKREIEELKPLLAFANRLHKLAQERNGKSSTPTRSSFSSEDLEKIYRFYSASLEGVGSLKKEVAANNEKSDVTSNEHDQGDPQKTHVLSSSNSGQTIEESWKFAKVTSTKVKKMISALNNVIQKLKQYDKISKRDVDQILTKLRTLRAIINEWCEEIENRSEENVVPQASNDSLIKENNEAEKLVEAEQLPDEAHNSLCLKASAGGMCERIVDEMRSIKDVLKTSTRDIVRLQSQKHEKEKQ